MADDDIIPAEPCPFDFCEGDADQLRRAWIFGLLADSEIDGHILVKNMACVEAWLKTGAVEKAQPSLKVVNKKAAE